MVCNDVKYWPEKDADSYYGRTRSEPLNPVTSLFAFSHLAENADPSFSLPICHARIQHLIRKGICIFAYSRLFHLHLRSLLIDMPRSLRILSSKFRSSVLFVLIFPPSP